jgi:hypothetical protein
MREIILFSLAFKYTKDSSVNLVFNKSQGFIKGPRVKLNHAFEEISKIKNSFVKLGRPIESCFEKFLTHKENEIVTRLKAEVINSLDN